MGGPYLVGRQPIFDGSLDVHGYELLFRGAEAWSGDGDAKTADVLVRVGLDLGLEDVVGDKLAFLNATRSLLVGDIDLPLPPERTVIEVLEDVGHDDEVVAGCRRLVEAGYTLALDDYVWAAGDEPLLELADIVKLDVLALGPDGLARQVERCAPFDVRLVAEKVETHEQLADCRRLGFNLFQGYVLARPEVLSTGALSPSLVSVLALIDRACDERTTTTELQQLVERDASLSVRLLRVAGAGAAGGLRREVRSIREAVVVLGRRRLQGWLTLILAGETGRVAPVQAQLPLTRAKMCEEVITLVDPPLSGSAFTVGLLSGLELLLGTPLDAVVAQLSLAEPLKAALLTREGPLGRLLADVLDWEAGRPPAPLRCGADPGVLEDAYLTALRWVGHAAGRAFAAVA